MRRPSYWDHTYWGRNDFELGAKWLGGETTAIPLWDQQYGVSIGEAGFPQINAIFHSERELIPTIQRSKWYFKYLD